VAGIRQIVESVYDKLFNAFGLHRERPHELSGLRARLAARAVASTIWPRACCPDGVRSTRQEAKTLYREEALYS
jgi:hypothetical protein